jgi:diaminohydroxyphosphoribosylaminopyrimidine deaminase/5-amino-6-(5-phosphoribosylamino)uracil reductase
VDLPALMLELGRRGINEVHVEAGRGLNGSLLRERCVDELLLYLAPMLVGDAAQGLFRLPALNRLDEALRLDIRDLRRVGEDFRLIARPRAANPAPN